MKEMKPDTVIIATGATPLIPPIPGVDRGNVVTAHDVLDGKKKVKDRVVVIGGGQVGMETAHFLVEKGKKLTMVVRTKMGKGMNNSIYRPASCLACEHGVEMLTNTRTEEITDAGVVVVDKEQKRRVIEADTIVLATGAKPNRVLQDALEDIAPEVYLVGMCLFPGNIRSATYQGASVARMLDNELIELL